MDQFYQHLNEFIEFMMHLNGVEYVIVNYSELREQYYEMKEPA